MADQATTASAAEESFLALFDDFARFGATPENGIARLAASKADGQAREHLCAWLEARGYDVLIDPVGNIFGVLDLGKGATDGHFFCGSHLDSQPHGGRFDGTLGVASACVVGTELRNAAHEGRISPRYRYYVVACWTNEEGARFQPSILGSGVYTGHITLDQALATADADGITLQEALDDIGYAGRAIPPRADRYLELHIEQGARLEEAGCPIGLVASCWGARKLLVEVKGRPDHTGPTPMDKRMDALLAASRLVLKVNEVANTASGPAHSSVGRMEIAPNSPNTVADRVRLWVEFRAGDEAVLDDMERALVQEFDIVEQQTGCAFSVPWRDDRAVLLFDAAGIDIIEAALDDAAIGHMRLPTIAGHDAVRLQSTCPTTLIFVPSRGGISHTPEEFTSRADMLAGFNAMVHAASALISTPVGDQDD